MTLFKKENIPLFIAAFFVLLLLLNNRNVENKTVLISNSDGTIGDIPESDLTSRHMNNFNNVKNSIKGDAGQNIRGTFRPVQAWGGRCHRDGGGHHPKTCYAENGNCIDGIHWCPTGTVPGRVSDRKDSECGCFEIHMNSSGYNFNPV